MRTKYEFKGVILNRFGFNKKEKNKLWRRAKKALELKPIAIGNRNISEYLERVREANAILVRQEHADEYEINYKMGGEDVEIIANYLKWGIGSIYTSDIA